MDVRAVVPRVPANNIVSHEAYLAEQDITSKSQEQITKAKRKIKTNFPQVLHRTLRTYCGLYQASPPPNRGYPASSITGLGPVRGFRHVKDPRPSDRWPPSGASPHGVGCHGAHIGKDQCERETPRKHPNSTVPSEGFRVPNDAIRVCHIVHQWGDGNQTRHGCHSGGDQLVLAPQALIDQALNKTAGGPHDAHCAHPVLCRPTSTGDGPHPSLLSENLNTANDAVSYAEEQRQGALPREQHTCTQYGAHIDADHDE